MTGRFWQRASYRIAATTASILATAAFVLGGGGLLLTQYHIRHALDARIAAASDPLVALAKTGDEEGTRRAIAAAVVGREDQLAIALFDSQGRHILGELKVSRPALGWSDVTFYDPVEGNDPARVLATDLPNGERIVVAGNRRPLETASEAISWLWAFSAGVILILSVSLVVLLGRYLDSRLEPITRTSDAVIAGDLSHRVPVSHRRDEFDRVAISLNTMLDRISELMANLRGIAGDIAHDLRTPLGRLRTRLETASADPASISREDVVETTIATIDEILALFHAVLRISEIEDGGAPQVRNELDLGRLAVEIVEAMQPVFEDAGLALSADVTPDLTTLGDRDQLASAIINVLENALAHSSMGAIVVLSALRNGDHIELKVCDSGPGVPAEDLERIFDRFVRLDAARSKPGHGLGLSLVRAVMHANHGTVGASNEPRGFVITLRFATTGLRTLENRQC